MASPEPEGRQQTSTLRQGGVAVVAALASALLFCLAMPGGEEGVGGWWPLLFCCLIPLLLMARLRPWPAAAGGFLFGLIAYGVQLQWIFIALSRYGGLPLGLSLVALFLLAAYMALYSALFCLLLAWLNSGVSADRHPGTRACIGIWMAPVLWVGLDSLRGLAFTGFPWMDLGYGLFRQPQLLVAADLGGHHLLSFCLVLVNALLAIGAVHIRPRRAPARTVLPSFVAAGCLLVGLGLYGLLRSAATREEMAQRPRAIVGVAQGNIAQDLKWSEAMKQATVERYLRLSQTLAAGGAELVVWPETALPFYPQDDPLTGQVAAFTAAGPSLLTGAPLYRIEDHTGGRLVHHYNGALLFGPPGRMDGLYSKQHLVPFGEYIPSLFRKLLSFLEPVAASGDFSAGRSATPIGGIDGGKWRLGVLICYESIFPRIARNTTHLGADLLVNITNDAWYGRSSAPVQSLAMATLRAVENRRALVRSANTGISAFIDPLGHISEETAIFTEAAAMHTLPLLQSKSFFTRAGHRFGILCILLVLPVLLLRLLLYRTNHVRSHRPHQPHAGAATPATKKTAGLEVPGRFCV